MCQIIQYIILLKIVKNQLTWAYFPKGIIMLRHYVKPLIPQKSNDDNKRGKGKAIFTIGKTRKTFLFLFLKC